VCGIRNRRSIASTSSGCGGAVGIPAVGAAGSAPVTAAVAVISSPPNWKSRCARDRLGFRKGDTIFQRPRQQYQSEKFETAASELAVCGSVGRTGSCHDNAWAESLNGTLKIERMHRTHDQNGLHPAFGYRTPNDVQNRWYETTRQLSKGEAVSGKVGILRPRVSGEPGASFALDFVTKGQL
jgi:hypothetical protein